MKKIPQIFPRWCGSLLGLLVLALPAPAWAHAFLDHAEPAVGSDSTQSPSEVKLWFTQELEGAFSKATVSDAQGQEVDKKDVHLDANDKKLMEVSLPPLASGTYTVNWTAVSVDTHKTQGSFKFTLKLKG
jgi:copper resistance protein C